MHKGGWKPFWAALGAALLVLLPLVGGTVLFDNDLLHGIIIALVVQFLLYVLGNAPSASSRLSSIIASG